MRVIGKSNLRYVQITMNLLIKDNENMSNTIKERFKIQDVARSSNVTRWHSVNCYRFPSIAEHSFLVTMYARELLYRIIPDASDKDRLLLLEFSLVHDLPEVLTGDMSTPIKRRIEAMFPEGESPLDKIEEDLCPDYKNLKYEIKGSPLQRIAKLADILEAIKFIDVEGKRQASCHDNNLQVLKILETLTDSLATGDAANEDVYKKVQETLQLLTKKEESDTINRIKTERIETYKKRVQEAQVEYPQYNWSHAYEVLEQLLNGIQSQIDFIE